ncbi:MAG TPA: hypothetical protein VJ483_01560 [Holophagaceae bacterium]|nr:hypothetical protein [Holophagaceae bacterium]
MASSLRSARERMAGQLSQRLQRVGHPRVQMALMVSATGSSGFLLDWLMLKAGVDRMALRYALAVLLAYGVFLLLIKVWLHFHRRRVDRQGGGGSDWGFSGGSSSGGSGSGGSSSAGDAFQGGGGSSGGGGASASFGEGQPAMGIVPPGQGSAPRFSGGGGSGGSGGGIDLDGDEILAILALLVALAAALAAAIYLVVQAPVIFGEVLLDGSLSAGLYKRLNKLEHHSWLETAIRKTAIPFAVVALLAGVAGHFAQKAAPEARSIGGVWHHIMD